MTTPEPPPEAQLIRRLREEMFPAVSMREAARRAGFSTTTWVQIEQGAKKVTGAITVPVSGTDEKVARMAHVVGATPDQLREAARPGAADMLRKIVAAGPDPEAQAVEKIRQSRDFTEAQKRVMIDALLRDDA